LVARGDKAIKPLEKALDWIIFAALLSLIAAALFPSVSLALFGLSLVLAVAVPWVVSVLVIQLEQPAGDAAFHLMGSIANGVLLHLGHHCSIVAGG
jgi:hypothetical protein